MLGKGTDLHSKGSSAEDSMKFNVAFPLSRDRYDATLYKEAARRVVFNNCMGECELEHADVPNFNKKFYYQMPQAQACLQTCYNERMTAHFGATVAAEENVLINFAQMKSDYQGYQRWLPQNKIDIQEQRGLEEGNVQNLLSNLREKSESTRGKY